MSMKNSKPFKYFLFSVLVVLCSNYQLTAQSSRGFDDKLNDAFMPVAIWWEDLILYELNLFGFEIPIVLILLLGGSLFFTIYFRFINVRGFFTGIKVVRGKYDDLESGTTVSSISSSLEIDGDIPDTIRDESQQGEVNHFQALATAVSGTVGLGNIALVAVAISIGGPGATFWMIIAGLLGMSTKLVECTLGVAYREVDASGRVFGGPMYYLSSGLRERGFPNLGLVLSYVFAVLCVGASFGGGNAFQSNQAAAQLISRFGLEGEAVGTMIGVLFAIIVGVVIIGGIKRIASVTEKVVPGMAILYVASALYILIAKSVHLPEAFSLILSEAFQPRAGIVGGVTGVIIQGFRRAAFSNEAGAGSAAIAHSAVKTAYPASEGLVALLEPFIDTVVICTMTALVIIIFNIEVAFVYGDIVNDEALILATGERVGGVNLTSLAFDSVLPGFSYVLAIAVVLFAFSTMLSWSYYGLQAWKYLFGKSQVADISFKVVFLLFTVLGSAITLEAVIKFSDAMILALVFPNMIGLMLLFPKVRSELKNYYSKIISRV